MPDAAQERALVRYLRRDVRSYSARYGVTLTAIPVQRVADVSRLPFTSLAEVDDTRAFVLRPTKETIAASGDVGLIARLWWASLWRRERALSDSVIDPVYKPVHWLDDDGVLLGYTAEDLERLAEVGRLRLQSAGVEPDDVLVSVVPPGPTKAFWQLHLGARRGGVPALFLSDPPAPAELARLSPSVLAGSEADLHELLAAALDAGTGLHALRTLVVVGPPIGGEAKGQLLAAIGAVAPQPDPAVVTWWAPAGVRSLWGECRGSDALHTVPAVDFVEIIDPRSGTAVPAGGSGEVVWTAIGWKGSVLVRLRTGVHATAEVGRCSGCGSDAPRLRVVEPGPAFARLLDEHPAVTDWQVELRTVDGVDELIVYLTPAGSGHPGALVRELDHALGATQFVVLDRATLAARVAAHDDARIVDARAGRGAGG